ncbi:HAD family hydrolase [Falsarthrobacter nasiphocae]|uniref:Cof subfamily protein (Haloacid dehalogenase superfamily) n=1 Tax=Falsarthrobacter nasiphocae TaxID=189863 RepID=A0AAE3YGZ9_9MICC|nr:HAD family hydrolase [Falsarthrobacter nasiphocae]MDR6892010.1 Cof subfamily protein (haloacid dehalogenase superfamily) [Falsarthrobacter nasiphocae]
MTPVRLIACDLDGTIVSHGTHAVSPRSVAAFGAARAAGYEVVFVTGRPPWYLAPLTESMGAAGHRIGRIICSNGAAVYDLESEEILATEPLPTHHAIETIEAVRALAPGVAFAAEALTGPVIEQPFLPAGFEAGLVVEDLAEALREDGSVFEGGVLKLHVFDPSGPDPDEFLARAAAGVSPDAYATRSVAGMAVFEVGRADVTKARTLGEYAHALGVGPEEIVAFGDMPNDLEMLRWVGTGFAMASGHPDVVAAADRTAPPIQEDGVAQVLEHLVATGELPAGLDRSGGDLGAGSHG